MHQGKPLKAKKIYNEIEKYEPNVYQGITTYNRPL